MLVSMYMLLYIYVGFWFLINPSAWARSGVKVGSLCSNAPARTKERSTLACKLGRALYACRTKMHRCCVPCVHVGRGVVCLVCM